MREPRINAIQIKVVPALRLRGSLNAVIPFEIASTPVSAVVPLAKALKIRNILIDCKLTDQLCVEVDPPPGLTHQSNNEKNLTLR